MGTTFTTYYIGSRSSYKKISMDPQHPCSGSDPCRGLGRRCVLLPRNNRHRLLQPMDFLVPGVVDLIIVLKMEVALLVQIYQGLVELRNLIHHSLQLKFLL